MSGFGAGAFVEGLFNGREIRQGWEDRKDAKKRQEWLDKLYEDGQGREAEAHRARMDAYGRQVSDWQRARDDEDRYRAAVDATFADGGMGAMGAVPGPAPSSVTASSKSPTADPVAGVAAGLGLPLGAVPNRAAEQFMRARPVESFQAPPATAPQTIAPTAQPAQAAPPPVASLGVMPVPPQGVAAPAAEAGPAEPTWEEWLAMSRKERKAAGLPETRIGGEWHYRNKKRPQPQDEATQRADAVAAGVRDGLREFAEVGGAVKRGAARFLGLDGDPMREFAAAGGEVKGRLQEAMGAGFAAVQDTDTAARLMRAGAENRKSAQEMVKPTPDEQKASPVPLPAATGPTRAAAKAASEVSGAALKAASEVAPGPTRAAAAALPEMGVSATSRPAPPERVERGATAFVDHYRTERVPAIVQELVRQGKLDQALRFQEFLDTRATQEGMKFWARAAVAGSMGDWDAFQTNIFAAYNATGYFDDGAEIVPEKSGFTSYKDGTPRGAKITLRRQDGAEQVIEFDSIEDFVQQGIMALSPENALAYTQARIDEAKKSALGVAQAEAEQAAKRQEAIRKRAGKILDGAMGTMTPEQAVAAAIAEDRAIEDALSRGAAPQEPPPARFGQ